MRAGVAQAIHHTAHRAAFGKELIDQPLMRNVLADLCVESEAATVAGDAPRPRLRRGRRRRRGARPSFKRIANAVLKYWICKRAPTHAVECLECLGGNGYVEESGMPRLFRESPLELDLGGLGQRPVPRRPAGDGQEPRRRSRPSSPRSLEGAGAEPRLDAYVAALRDEIPGDIETIESRARRIVERMALALQASLLVRFGDAGGRRRLLRLPPRRRLGPRLRHAARRHGLRRIIERHRPSAPERRSTCVRGSSGTPANAGLSGSAGQASRSARPPARR